MKKLTKNEFDGLFSIMEQSFPSDEYRTRVGQLSVFDDPRYSAYGEYEDGRLIGFISTWEFDELIFIEHFAVKPELRGRGIGAKMLSELIQNVEKTVCLEVEPPVDGLTMRRIAFYERCGFCYNDYNYTQPSMDVGKNPIPLRVMTYGSYADPATFKKIKSILYKNVYHVTED